MPNVPPGIAVSGLRATLDLDAARDRRLRLIVESGTLVISEAGAECLIPPTLAVKLTALRGGRLHVHTHFTPIGADVELLPEILADGWVRLRAVSVRAAGFLPLPAGAVASAALKLLPRHPGLRQGESGHLELDLAALLAPLGLVLPRLHKATAAEGLLELIWHDR